MTPYEILLSESQERMLIIAKQGKEDLVRQIFDKWDVTWAEIGRVTDDGMMRVRNNGSVAADIPAKPLADEAPLYSREAKAPRTAGTSDAKEFLKTIPFPSDSSVNAVTFVRDSLRDCCERLRSLRRIGFIASSITWFARARSSGPVPMPRSFVCAKLIKFWQRRPTGIRSIAGSTARGRAHRGGGSGRYCHLFGRRPLAVTDNLNFGDPTNRKSSGNSAKQWKAQRKRAARSAPRSPAAMSLYIMRVRRARSIRR